MESAFNILCLVWSIVVCGASIYFKARVHKEVPKKVPVQTVVRCLNCILALGVVVGVITIVIMISSMY